MYEFKTKPFDHQLEEFEKHSQAHVRGLWWEQGCGKTKPVIDSFCDLLLAGKVDALFVLAPNGVHINWTHDEIPAHMPDGFLQQATMHAWQSKKAKTKRHQRAFEECFKSQLPILTMGYPGIMTEAGRAAAKKFLTKRKCLYVLDESHFIKTPGAKRTKRILASGEYADFRRCLTGTPVANKPFDVYAQVKFLEPRAWEPLGIKTFAAFKSFFGIWETRNGPNGDFQQCVAFKNLDKMAEVVAKYGSRLTKDEALPWLPPKLYSKRAVEPTAQQMKVYNDLKYSYISLLESGAEVTGEMALVRMLKFQQILYGYVVDDEGEQHRIEGPLPRLDMMMDEVKELPHKALVWTGFHQTMDDICNAMEVSKLGFAWADGRVTGDDRVAALERFKKDPECQFLCCGTAALNAGYTLTQAKSEYYYSNSFNLVHRKQSEDRAHRHGQDSAVNIVDFYSPGLVDEYIINALVKKNDIAAMVTGDTLKDWI